MTRSSFLTLTSLFKLLGCLMAVVCLSGESCPNPPAVSGSSATGGTFTIGNGQNDIALPSPYDQLGVIGTVSYSYGGAGNGGSDTQYAVSQFTLIIPGSETLNLSGYNGIFINHIDSYNLIGLTVADLESSFESTIGTFLNGLVVNSCPTS